VSGGVSSNQKISENPPRARIAVFSTAFRVAAKGSSGRSPYRFAQMPINRDSRVFKEPIHELFAATGTSYQFGEDRCGHGYISMPKS